MAVAREDFDVVVVGGRCAGAPLAQLLAEDGLRVCVVDRDRFPSDTPSTHGIQPAGAQILERLGVLARLPSAARVRHGRAAFDDVRLDLRNATDALGGPMLNARRVTLDAALLAAAAAAGAEVRTGCAVTGLHRAAGRVAGVETREGRLRARLVVGADGARSLVARQVGAAEYHATEAGRVFLWGYYEGAQAPEATVWLGKIRDHAYLASPTDSGLFMAAVAPSAAAWPRLRGDREDALAAGLGDWPELAAVVAGTRRVGPVNVMANWHGFFRESAGPGWVLAGDAGHFKDPTPGQGISDALRQVVELAPAIARGLAGSEADLDAELRAWWAWRDRDAWEMYWLAHQLGAPGPTPLPLLEVMRRLETDPRLADGLMRVLNHEQPPSQVFTLPVVLRATVRALRDERGQRRRVLRELRGLAANELRQRSAAPRRVSRRLARGAPPRRGAGPPRPTERGAAARPGVRSARAEPPGR